MKKDISKMSREELIEEIMENQKEGLAYLQDSDLQAMIVDFRTSTYKRNLVTELTGKEIKPNVHYHGMSVNPESSDQGHGHGFL